MRTKKRKLRGLQIHVVLGIHDYQGMKLSIDLVKKRNRPLINRLPMALTKLIAPS